MSEALTYGSYLKLSELLSLQEPLSEGPEHDEMLFIVIHQVYELWFKEVIHELDHVMRLLEEGHPSRASHTLKRILTILKVLVAQLDILETMTPLEFLSFRERLEQASGFQSYQFRELEMILGRKRRQTVDHFPQEDVKARLGRRFEERTLWDALLRCLSAQGFAVPETDLERDPTQPIEGSAELQDVLIEVYRNDPRLSEILERFVDLDEGLMEWRYRHVKMVERTIGTKQGTGGSAGAAYLSTTLSQPAFPDLWAIRSRL
jgi:tryptophan 2,3-dioxygenase